MTTQRVKPAIRGTAVPGVYTCSSTTRAALTHTVNVRHASRPTCTCEAGQYNFSGCTLNPFCLHVRLVLDYHRHMVAALNAHADTRRAATFRASAGYQALAEAFA